MLGFPVAVTSPPIAGAHNRHDRLKQLVCQFQTGEEVQLTFLAGVILGRSKLGIDRLKAKESNHVSLGTISHWQGVLAMDGTATMSDILNNFRTPIRILLPKLLNSRDAWKTKSHQRKAQLKAAKIKIRDLDISRTRWRKQHQQLHADHQVLQAQYQQLHSEHAQLKQRLADAERERERDEARSALTQNLDAQKK
jgi:hypothetical protein